MITIQQILADFNKKAIINNNNRIYYKNTYVGTIDYQTLTISFGIINKQINLNNPKTSYNSIIKHNYENQFKNYNSKEKKLIKKLTRKLKPNVIISQSIDTIAILYHNSNQRHTIYIGNTRIIITNNSIISTAINTKAVTYKQLLSIINQ